MHSLTESISRHFLSRLSVDDYALAVNVNANLCNEPDGIRTPAILAAKDIGTDFVTHSLGAR